MKKVEAFEKHAGHAVASPANMRARTRAALGVTPSHVSFTERLVDNSTNCNDSIL